MTIDQTNSLAEQNVALLQRFFDSLNSWDFEAMRQIFHPDVVVDLPYVFEPFPSEVRGFDAVMAFMEGVPDFAEAENLSDFSLHAFADDPNELVAEFRSDMKLRNGREHKNQYVVRATVCDGKLILYREYMNPIKLLMAVGGKIVPPPG
ncbi:MAG: hypothetical protein JWN99_555 [Ilumatobacteraceae bacterium]|nr:hypothetical protein [Ilumatobacteraceae bacterium]